MKTRAEAEQLSSMLTKVGSGAGLHMRTVLSDMNQPLGQAVGNAVEVEEAISCLQGAGPTDLSDLVCDLIGDPKAKEVLASGEAFAVWERMVVAQGGNLNVPLKGIGCQETVLESPVSGVIRRCDAYNIGYASVLLGGGRMRAQDPIHHGVGIWLQAKVGDVVEKGQPLATMLHTSVQTERALELLTEAYVIDE